VTKEQQRAETEALVRKARFGKRKLAITRCPAGMRQWDSNINYRHGGVLPGHLDPRTMGEV